LHLVREPPEMLGPLHRTLGEYSFAAQYQQAPPPAEHYVRSEQLRSWNATRRIPIPK
jgi:hypothetical protein